MCLLWLFVLVGPVAAMEQVTERVNSLYDQLDVAIEHSADYVKQRQGRIAKYKKAFCHAEGIGVKQKFAMILYDEYRSFQNDSAIAYISKCIDYAKELGDKQAEANAKALLAFQCSTTGKYNESSYILSQIDTTALAPQVRRNYLVACQHLYTELSYYANIDELRRYYQAKAVAYNQMLLKELNPNDDHCLQLLEIRCRESNDIKKALEYNDLRMRQAKFGTHQYAIVAFYRALIFKKQKKLDLVKYWLLQSALCDVRLAVMDQGSLWELANLLSKEPDGLARSYQYIKFTWKAANVFNTVVRSNQIMPVLTSIEDSYQQQLAKSNRRMKAMIAVSVLLIVIVLSLLCYVNKQRKRLAMAHAQQKQTNADLQAVNESLNESDKMKVMYIGKFLQLSVSYMDKLETMRRRVTKLVKNREFLKLNDMLQGSDDDNAEFYEYFDSAFLRLFPNFVSDFNALLRPEERISLPDENRLTTTIRIFALIRLGIEDSSKIAEFLHYSVNTIYNYRAKVKNGSACDRNVFEERVKQIGM